MSGVAPYPFTDYLPEGSVDVLVIAGEHSGDQHAATLVQEMWQCQPDLAVVGVGGPALQQAGVPLLTDLTEIAVIGLVEVLKHYPTFKYLFDRILDWVDRYRPRHICFVDYPGLNLRLAQALTDRGLSVKGGGAMGLHFYIGPQVWAWKAKRRFRMEKILDSLGVIFPFEVEAFADTSLPVNFVGHPYVLRPEERIVSYSAEGPVLLLPGSRHGPIRRIFPQMLLAWRSYRSRTGDGRRMAVIYANDSLLATVQDCLEAFPDLAAEVDFVSKDEPGGICGSLVLASSGTMSLQCALAGIPGVLFYQAHPLTYAMGKILIKIEYLGINNLLLQRSMYREFIQQDAVPARVVEALLEVDSESGVARTQGERDELMDLLRSPEDLSPGRWLLERMDCVGGE